MTIIITLLDFGWLVIIIRINHFPLNKFMKTLLLITKEKQSQQCLILMNNAKWLRFILVNMQVQFINYTPSQKITVKNTKW